MTGRVYPDGVAGPFPEPPHAIEDREGRRIRFRRVELADDADDAVEGGGDEGGADRATPGDGDGDSDGPVPATAVLEMYVDYDPADRAQGIPPTGEDRIREWLGEVVPGGVDVAAVHDGAVVGHATLVPDGADAHELAVFVDQPYQGAGIGTALVRTLLGAGAAAGVERVWLTVEPWNRAAVRLYETLGFEPSGRDGFEREYSIRLGRS